MPRARLPEPGAAVPRVGGPLTNAIGRIALRIFRWRVEGAFPDVPRAVLIVAPHTSNWDFPIGVAAKLALRLRVIFLGKHTLFTFPLGILMRRLGGMPVDRSGSFDMVNSIVAEFQRRDRLFLVVAPEGTRKHVERWRTGFYHIAHRAGVPIVPIAFNWRDRAVQIQPPFDTTGDADADIAQLQQRFAGIPGRFGPR